MASQTACNSSSRRRRTSSRRSCSTVAWMTTMSGEPAACCCNLSRWLLCCAAEQTGGAAHRYCRTWDMCETPALQSMLYSGLLLCLQVLDHLLHVSCERAECKHVQLSLTFSVDSRSSSSFRNSMLALLMSGFSLAGMGPRPHSLRSTRMRACMACQPNSHKLIR